MRNNDNNLLHGYDVDAYLKVRDDTAIVVSAPEGPLRLIKYLQMKMGIIIRFCRLVHAAGLM